MTEADKQVLSLKQAVVARWKSYSWIRWACILLIGFWIVAVTRFTTEHLLYREGNLKTAMALAEPGITVSTLEYAARLQKGYLTESDKKNLLLYAAGKLGLIVDSPLDPITAEGQSGFTYHKTAKRADTFIKLITLTEEDGTFSHYLLLRLSLTKDDGDGILFYRDKMTSIAEEIGLQEEQVSIQLTGSFDEKMSLAAMNQLTKKIMKKLNCDIVCENRDESLYTVYAYTNGIDEYILSGKDRINVQLAMYYDETEDKTILCLASPVITGEI